MKVLFVFGGLPHYHNAIFNLLHRTANLEVVVLVPSTSGGKTLGAGVYETIEGIEFKVRRATEVIKFYKKPYFKNFSKILFEEKPQIIVIGWPYILGYLLDFKSRRIVKRNNIKLILKSIPYQIPLYREALKFYTHTGVLNESLQRTKADSLIKKLKYLLITEINKYYFNLVDAHVNYVSEAYNILGSYGVAKEKIFVTYNSGDTDTLLKVKEKISSLLPVRPYNPYRIIHVGRLIKWKKVDLLIKAFKLVKSVYTEANLVIVGSGPEENFLKNLSKELDLENSILFTGAIHDPEKLGEYFQSSGLYVLAGIGGLSINDAMTFSLPVICSVGDGTEKELIIEGVTGYFFEEDNLEDLVEKISLILSDTEKAKQMGANATHLIENKINMHTVVKGYLQAFNFVTNNQYSLTYPIYETTSCSGGSS